MYATTMHANITRNTVPTHQFLSQYINRVPSYGPNKLQLEIVLGKFCSFLNKTYWSQLKVIPCQKAVEIPFTKRFFKPMFQKVWNFMILQKYMLCMVLQGTHTPILRLLPQSSTKLWPFFIFVDLLRCSTLLDYKIMKI